MEGFFSLDISNRFFIRRSVSPWSIPRGERGESGGTYRERSLHRAARHDESRDKNITKGSGGGGGGGGGNDTLPIQQHPSSRLTRLPLGH